MKIFKNKEFTRLIINDLCLTIVIMLYLFSPLLKLVFNVWLVIIVGLLIFVSFKLEFNLKQKEKVKKIVETMNEYIQIFLFAVIIIEVIFTFVMFPATVNQNSMYPTLLPNDQLIIKRTNKFKNNDIIVFSYDDEIQKGNLGVPNKELLIKRIIVCPGQTFEYIGKDLYIDGKKVDDQYAVEDMDGLTLETICKLNGLEQECLQPDGTYKIPEGWYVVFGDNRQYTGSKIPLSIDSRSFGLVHESQIFGIAKYEMESIFEWKKLGE